MAMMAGASTSSPAAALCVPRDAMMSARRLASSTRTLRGPISLPVAAPSQEEIAARASLRFWDGSGGSRRRTRRSWGPPRGGRRVSTLERAERSDGWRCYAELKNSEPDADTATSPGSRPDCCDDGPTSTTELPNEASTTGASEPLFETYGPTKRGNQLVALASSSIAVGLFLIGRFGGGGPALPELAASSVPYEEALRNGRPTVVEFYADWCEVCKEAARDVYQVEQEYRDRINFVMLNVDNSKWEQELDEFGVEGIPHFAFLDNQGNEEGNIVGRLPKTILKENLAALSRGDARLPHSRVVGQFSNTESRTAPPVVGPRSHSPTS